MAHAGYQIENMVLIGDKGELFLGAGAHNVLKYATGELSVKKESVDNFHSNFLARESYCRSNGISFLQMVAPEKYKVMPENFPVEEPKSFWDSHEQAHNYDHPCFWYGIADLRDNPFGRSYYLTDTHWTAAGMMVACLEAAKKAGFGETEQETLVNLMLDNTAPLDKMFYGDLGRKLDPQQGESVNWPRRSRTIEVVENGIGHDYTNPVNDGRMVVSVNPGAVSTKTLLIFGDSYLFNALNFIQLAFEKVVFCRTRFFHDEMVTMVQPDLVVCQAAERYTRQVSLDSKAPPFLLLPYVLGRAPTMEAEDASFISRVLSSGKQPDFEEYSIKKP